MAAHVGKTELGVLDQTAEEGGAGQNDKRHRPHGFKKCPRVGKTEKIVKPGDACIGPHDIRIALAVVAVMPYIRAERKKDLKEQEMNAPYPEKFAQRQYGNLSFQNVYYHIGGLPFWTNNLLRLPPSLRRRE